MASITVSTTIAAPPATVWSTVEDIAGHVAWMDDAVAIRFTSDRRSGVGTTFECDTKVGPFRLVDTMKITEWKTGKVLGVRHIGIVSGQGRFTLRKARRGRTKITWTEKLRFPLWLGGPLAANIAGRVVLKRIWKKNLRNLAAIVEG